jgi:hypothetical protein
MIVKKFRTGPFDSGYTIRWSGGHISELSANTKILYSSTNGVRKYMRGKTAEYIDISPIVAASLVPTMGSPNQNPDIGMTLQRIVGALNSGDVDSLKSLDVLCFS